MADVGQEEVSHLILSKVTRRSHIYKDFVAAEKKALKVGAKKFFLEVRFDHRYQHYNQ